MFYRYLPLLLALTSNPAHSFSFTLDKNTYMPGEPMQIICSWPDEVPDYANWIQFYSIDNSGDYAGEDVPPGAQISYHDMFQKKRCVELRAPWRPGQFVVKAAIFDKPLDQKIITVTDLPEIDELTFVGIQDRFNPEVSVSGSFFAYDLKFSSDRCYPDNNYFGKGKKPILMFLYEESTKEIHGNRDDVFLSGEKQCLSDCDAPVIQHACEPTGTFRRFLRVPETSGKWLLTFGQQLSSDESCGDKCIRIPQGGSGGGQYFRVLAQVPTVEPVDVKEIYFSLDSEGQERIAAADIIAADYFYVWVEFVSENQFQREVVRISLDEDDAEELELNIKPYKSSKSRYWNGSGVSRKVLMEALLKLNSTNAVTGKVDIEP
jgi:hypothetical protein